MKILSLEFTVTKYSHHKFSIMKKMIRNEALISKI